MYVKVFWNLTKLSFILLSAAGEKVNVIQKFLWGDGKVFVSFETGDHKVSFCHMIMVGSFFFHSQLVSKSNLSSSLKKKKSLGFLCCFEIDIRWMRKIGNTRCAPIASSDDESFTFPAEKAINKYLFLREMPIQISFFRFRQREVNDGSRRQHFNFDYKLTGLKIKSWGENLWKNFWNSTNNQEISKFAMAMGRNIFCHILGLFGMKRELNEFLFLTL